MFQVFLVAPKCKEGTWGAVLNYTHVPHLRFLTVTVIYVVYHSCPAFYTIIRLSLIGFFFIGKDNAFP